jgi:hypothetical protein
MAATDTPWSEKKQKRLGPAKAGQPIHSTSELKAEICRLLSEGATTREVCDLPSMPARKTLFEWLSADHEFRAHYEEAKVLAAQVIVDEAMDYAREAVESGSGSDHTRARIAESFANVAIKYAEKVAPRQFGQLVKLGNSEGDGPAVIQLVNYATQAIDRQSHLAIADGTKEGQS